MYVATLAQVVHPDVSADPTDYACRRLLTLLEVTVTITANGSIDVEIDRQALRRTLAEMREG